MDSEERELPDRIWSDLLSLKHEGLEYKDLGVDYFDRLEPERLRSYLVKRLQRLGYRVTLTPQGEADAA
jgi:hypothetical protein